LGREKAGLAALALMRGKKAGSIDFLYANTAPQ